MTAERKALRTGKTFARKADIELPEELAQSFVDRAAALKALPEYEQFRAAQSLVGDIKKLVPPSKWNYVLDVVLALPRSLKATWDLSWPLRQGIISGLGRPKEFLATNRANVQAFLSEEAAQTVEAKVASYLPRIQA